MLVELTIRDVALIEEAGMALGEGLNVLTGETGAGKTLFVGSLELLLGQTPKGGAGRLVRSGASEARVEGRFLVTSAEVAERVAAFFRDELPALADDWDRAWIEGQGEAELILGRTVSAEGRTRAHLDQRPVPVRALRGIGALLLEIHGQNDHQGLLEPREQLRLLDSFGGAGQAVATYRAARATWGELVTRGRRLAAQEQERRARLDFLRFQRDELEDAGVEDGEHERLVAERDVLRSAGDVRAQLGAVTEELCDGDPALRDRLRAAEQTLERWQDLLPALAGTLEDLRAARVHVDEVGASLGSLLDRVEDDPARLDGVEERLAVLERLEAKHATDGAGLVTRAAELTAEIEALEADEASLVAIEDETAAALEALEAAAAELAKRRKRVAPRLAKAVTTVLGELGLAKAKLDVAFAPREGDDEHRFGPDGTQDVELLLAANPGEAAKPLRHVASGGEAARIMLALRTVLTAGDGGRTLAFDEIDAGVGGRLGPEVGAHLRRLAESHQVLCVTHLPAIAAQAHVHLHVAKSVAKGRTRTQVRRLEGDERVAEVADMIAGGSDQDTARAEARRLLQLGT